MSEPPAAAPAPAPALPPEPAPLQTSWRRLDPRMLLIHPVQEAIRHQARRLVEFAAKIAS